MSQEKHEFKNFAINEAISKQIINDCCKSAFFCGMFKTIGSIEISRKGALAVFVSENENLLELLKYQIKNVYMVNVDIETSKFTFGAKKGLPKYLIKVPKGQTKQMIEDTGLMELDGDSYLGFSAGIPQNVVSKICCLKTLLRTAFMAAGYIYVPSIGEDTKKSEGYHLEIQLPNEKTIVDLCSLLKNVGITSKTNERNSYFSVYIKDKNQIVNFFDFMELNETAFKLRDIISEREINANLNRNIICETANLDKSYTASAEHILALEKIKEEIGFENLTNVLRDTANERIENPRLSMQELADKMKITKSCLNHRLRKLMQIADGCLKK